jgi:hypothetical protein
VPRIIRDLPFLDQPRVVEVGGEFVRIRPYQVVVWVSLAELGAAPFDNRTPRIPAVYDTGFNGDFLIGERHLTRWAGVDPRHFLKVGKDNVWGHSVDKRMANLWLHPNVSGTTDAATQGPPFRLELVGGILIVPKENQVANQQARLPLLGMRAFDGSGLRVTIDHRRRRFHVRTPLPFWPF